MPANRDLIETIMTLLTETGHSPEDVLENMLILAGCCLQTTSKTNHSITSPTGDWQFTLTVKNLKKD